MVKDIFLFTNTGRQGSVGYKVLSCSGGSSVSGDKALLCSSTKAPFNFIPVQLDRPVFPLAVKAAISPAVGKVFGQINAGVHGFYTGIAVPAVIFWAAGCAGTFF